MGIKSAVALSLLLLAGAASAQIETSFDRAASGDWSATAGRTAGDGNSIMQVEAGWPGVGFTSLHGANETTDIGFHVGLNYGFEGTTDQLTGVNFAVPYRHTLGQSGNATLALRADPGLSIYGNHGALVGVGGPIGVVAGFQVDPRLTLSVGADVPVLLSFSNPTGFYFGPQAGAGGEYYIERNLAFTARFRVGPEFALNSAGTGRQASFTTLIGLAYNTR